MFFVIPEMPSKTFVMLYKKLADHFKDINRAIANIKTKRTIQFVDWCPTGFKIGNIMVLYCI